MFVYFYIYIYIYIRVLEVVHPGLNFNCQRLVNVPFKRIDISRLPLLACWAVFSHRTWIIYFTCPLSIVLAEPLGFQRGPRQSQLKACCFAGTCLFGTIRVDYAQTKEMDATITSQFQTNRKIHEEHLQHQQPISTCEACVLALSISMSLNYSWASPFLCLQSSFVLLGYMRSLVRRS